ncbi:MAG: urea transporter [Chitinophagales bacterium]
MLTQKLKLHTEGLLHGYSQVFFARSRWYGVLLLLVSFADWRIGLAGFLCVVFSNLLADIFSLNAFFIEEGIYGFSAALAGMGIGATFEINTFFFITLLLAAFLILLTTKLFKGLLDKYKLPFLGLPFVTTFWFILLAAKFFTALHYRPIDSFAAFPFIQSASDHILQLNLPEVAVTFLRSLGAVFFQPNVFAGLLIAIGLLLYSRITFTLAALGLGAAYVFYHIAGIDTAELNRVLVGSNYFFAAIAIGGFYLIPNAYSYLLAVCMVPLVAALHYSLSYIFGMFMLPVYTTGFTFASILVLYLLSWRVNPQHLVQVIYQYCSPEQNLRHYLVTKENYRYSKFFPLSLPFWGEWMVSQGHEGKITHLGDWSKAFDFIVLDDEMKSYQDAGTTPEDFYAYDKPVLAPGEGQVVVIEDGIEENSVADMNLAKNWGNTVIISHGNGLFSQLSHLKKGSIKVKMGEYVYRGTPLGTCGNSGRSPEPHVHFQLQNIPMIGAKTLDYPLASYVVRNNNNYELKIFDKPKEGEFIRPAEINPLLEHAFYLLPGMKMRWVRDGVAENWEVFTDAWNRTYIYSYEYKSTAWFANDGVVFKFLDFEGSKKSFLYYFYLGCYKVFLGYYQDLKLSGQLPVSFLHNRAMEFATDLIRPFVQPLRTDFELHYTNNNTLNNSGSIQLRSSSAGKIGNSTLRQLAFDININETGLNIIIVQEGDKKWEAVCAKQ